MTYIATFYSHFTAMSFAKALKKDHLPAKLMPVPRNLSSSCGTCVRFECSSAFTDFAHDGIEKIYLMDHKNITILYES